MGQRGNKPRRSGVALKRGELVVWVPAKDAAAFELKPGDKSNLGIVNILEYCNKTLIMHKRLYQLLKAEEIPEKLWPKVAADLSVVLKVAKETNGKATAIKPPSVRRRASITGMTEDQAEKLRAKWRAKRAKTRQNAKARAATLG